MREKVKRGKILNCVRDAFPDSKKQKQSWKMKQIYRAAWPSLKKKPRVQLMKGRARHDDFYRRCVHINQNSFQTEKAPIDLRWKSKTAKTVWLQNHHQNYEGDGGMSERRKIVPKKLSCELYRKRNDTILGKKWQKPCLPKILASRLEKEEREKSNNLNFFRWLNYQRERNVRGRNQARTSAEDTTPFSLKSSLGPNGGPFCSLRETLATLFPLGRAQKWKLSVKSRQSRLCSTRGSNKMLLFSNDEMRRFF